MKKIALRILCCTFLFVGTISLQAQEPEEKNSNILNEEDEEGPLMFKFEPNFLTSVEIRREQIKNTRAIIDTLDISEGKRKRLLRDLYKNGISKRLSKALVAESNFEDEVDEDIEN